MLAVLFARGYIILKGRVFLPGEYSRRAAFARIEIFALQLLIEGRAGLVGRIKVGRSISERQFLQVQLGRRRAALLIHFRPCWPAWRGEGRIGSERSSRNAPASWRIA
jgi:hypothetical protein